MLAILGIIVAGVVSGKWGVDFGDWELYNVESKGYWALCY